MGNFSFSDLLDNINDIYTDAGEVLGSVNANYKRVGRARDTFSPDVINRVAQNINRVEALKEQVHYKKIFHCIIRIVVIIATVIVWLIF